MIRGTTPDYVLTIPGVDLTGQAVFVTIAQTVAARVLDLSTAPAAYRLTKTGDALSIASDSTGSTVAFRLSQNETLMFKARPALIQVRFIDSTGVAQATEIKSITIDPVLLEEVISYE